VRRLGLRGFVVFGFTIVVMAVAGTAFVWKMADFVMTIGGDEVQGFGVAAVATYLIGMLPIVFLTLWAVLTGRFRNIEEPKYRMLEMDREVERGGELAGRRSHG
jgi:hypothetical protein